MIISASRRTDIPAFHFDWFMNRLRQGFCLVRNPFNPARISRISLIPADVDMIVFWSKNPAPVFAHLDEIEGMGFPYYFLFTLNEYPAALEPNVPPVSERIRTFLKLSDRIGKERVVWRYDPIILSQKLDCDYHMRTFEKIARSLRGHTRRVIISIVDFYRKTDRRMKVVEAKTGDFFCRDPFRFPRFDELIDGLISAASQNELEIQSCAEDERLSRAGIRPGRCIDDKLIQRVFGIPVNSRKDPGQRHGCLCVLSRDIGEPDSCLHGCEYCYSTVSLKAASERMKRHDPDSPLLIGKP